MILGVPRESFPGERRVAMAPEVAARLGPLGLEVVVERGAGEAAGFSDDAYLAQSARIVERRQELFQVAQVVLQVRGLGANPEAGRADMELLRPGQVLVGMMNPLGSPQSVGELARRGVTVFALELVPRISRAQPMDALTSMASVSGYKAAIMAADTLPRMFPLMMSAAGTVTPARVFVLGAGVAGLQAIATCRRLGAVVQAYDIRPAAKGEVESLGARFLEVPLETSGAEGAGGYARAMGEEFYRRQREAMGQALAESDVVIATAAVPGRKAPVLVTEDMVARMRPGSLIVDLAAESGGNCALTKPGTTVEIGGVTIMGPVNLPSTIPYHASQMFARNMAAFLPSIVKGGEFRLDTDDQVVRETLVVLDGRVVHPQVKELLEASFKWSGEKGGG